MTNTGNVTLSGITLTYDQDMEVSCPNTLLAGASMICTASDTAVAGQYAIREPQPAHLPGDVPDVSDSDSSHYFGVFSGDINTDGSIAILDVIPGLQMINYIETASSVDIVVDVNGYGQIGIEEVLYALQTEAGLKP